MNGGASSTLPARNPRPVSLHSLPEHHRNSPVHLSPHPHRRPRTPRSSPLAGPSLSSDGVDSENKDDQGDQKPRYRPNRISSTPDIAVPIQSLYDSDTTSLSSLIPNGSVGVIFPCPSIPKSSGSSSSSEDDKEKESTKGKEDAEDGNERRSSLKRLSIISSLSFTTSEKGKDDQKKNRKRASFTLHSASMTSLASSSSSRNVRTDRASQTAPPIPTIPRWALNAMREEAGTASRTMKYGNQRVTDDDLAVSSIHQSTSASSNPPSISRDPTENWMSMTDPTPKFSRLGLGGNGVVMPVRKRESVARVQSAGSKVSIPADANRDSGNTSKTQPSPGIDSRNDLNAVETKPSLDEGGLRQRTSSLAGSLIAKVSISSSSDGTEFAFPLPPTVSKSGLPLTSIKTSLSTPNDSTPKTPKTSVSPPLPIVTSQKFMKTLRRKSGLTAIDESQLSSSLPNDTPAEFGRRGGHEKSQDTQSSKTRRKSIRQIVMRITTAPMSANEKLKLTTIHDSPSTPVLVLPPETLMPLDPPPVARFGKLASSSVPSLPSTKELPECGDARGGKRFKSIKKRWNAVFGTVRG